MLLAGKQDLARHFQRPRLVTAVKKHLDFVPIIPYPAGISQSRMEYQGSLP